MATNAKVYEGTVVQDSELGTILRPDEGDPELARACGGFVPASWVGKRLRISIQEVIVQSPEAPAP